MKRLKTVKQQDILPHSTKSILESISDGVFTVDSRWRITSFNHAAEEITGIPREEALGRRCSDVFRSNMCEIDCALRETRSTGKSVIGKSGYIIDADGTRIPVSVSTAVLRNENGEVVGGAETFRDLSEIESLRKELEGRFQIGDLVSHSPLMQRIFEILPAVASSPSTVLILGETGTGKELLARTIHSLSSRSEEPFVAVNCGALPDTLLESELFGYKSGAFTGATKDKPGRFAIAQNGTLFLDEIGEVSQALQVRLLRVLQDKVYEPLGSTHSETTNARIIVATNADLSHLMKEGDFREDLYYRINVIRLELPPLRRRKEDIPTIVEGFIQRFNRIQRKTIAGITPEALSILMAHEWPGNVRELENLVERAFILCQSGFIGVEHLPEEFSSRSGNAKGTHIRSTLDMVERQAIQKALEKHHFNRTAAAKELGIHKTTLFRKMKKLAMPLPEKDGRYK